MQHIKDIPPFISTQEVQYTNLFSWRINFAISRARKGAGLQYIKFFSTVKMRSQWKISTPEFN